MAMAGDYSFEVAEAVHPSGLIQYQGGQATTSRQFLMSCKNAEEFALRQIGKFYNEGAGTDYLVPVLPASFPTDSDDELDKNYGRIEMIAVGFSIAPVCSSCLNTETTEGTALITNPENISQMERYWYSDDVVAMEGNSGINDECFCIVTVNYEEAPWDCRFDDSWMYGAGSSILDNTAIGVERNPAYELFTMPSRVLVWKRLPGAPVTPYTVDEQLKDDSFAYMIIPKADVIVHWYNVPVASLCLIEQHLATFRNAVNEFSIDSLFFCGYSGAESGPAECDVYLAETMMFIDWQEDRSQRTNAFKNRTISGVIIDMNTTTLKLVFKQKSVVDPFNGDTVGWNHLMYDRGQDDSTSPIWRRVEIIAGTSTIPLFRVMDFDDILRPTI